MKLKTLTKEQIIRICLFGAFQAFAVGSMLYSLIGLKDVESAFVCVTTMLFLLIPDVVQRLMHFKIPLPLYIFAFTYGICHMLGHTYNFYYVPWLHWDKILHTTGGVAFALVGAYFPKLILKRNDCSVILCAFFGIAFSVLISVLWEFFEFGFDLCFQGDMQKDTIVDHIYSYKFAEELLKKGFGIVEKVDMDQLQIVYKGEVLLTGGYLDIGLFDSMIDMMVETLGAVLFAVVYVIDKGKHTSFTYLGKTVTEPVLEPQITAEAAVSEDKAD